MSDIIDSINASSLSQSDIIAGRLILWSDEDKNSVQEWIDYATQVDLDSIAMASIIALASDSTNTEILNVLGTKAKMEIDEVNDALRGSYIVQDAKKPLIQAEPKSTNGVGVTNQPDANYSLADNNSESYGFIDSVKNWFKVDKTTRRVESVLANGTMIRVDRDGNVTVYTKGNVKQIIEGNYVVDVSGNYELYVGGNKIEKITGKVTETYSSSHDTTVSGIRNEKAARINHN